jgi:ParB family chromosome partitioning protein
METRKALETVSSNLDESMGRRDFDVHPPVLSPVPHGKDAGRRPVRQFGKVEITRVMPDPKQPREDFSEDALDRLANSIQKNGQFNPIRVRWSDEYEMWVIISGERRWRAALKAGLQEIACYFVEKELDQTDILEEQLIENCLREDLQPIEEAKAFADLMIVRGWTGKDLAQALNISASRVSRALSLLTLPETVQDQVAAGEVPARTAYELSKLDNQHRQVELAQRAAAGAITAEQAGKQVRKLRGKSKTPSRLIRQTFPSEGGWKVVVSGPAKGTFGHIEQALSNALEEVRHRIKCGRPLF